MNKIILLCFLLLGYFAQAQHLPFQGKLLENSQPINGTKTFQFNISNSGVNWNETQTVQVNNGLYAVVLGSVSALPQTLFTQQIPLNLVISVNGTLLDTVQIYPPIEADPGVQANVKDGVSWNEVSGTFPYDVSSTNELQNLSINGQVLSIQNGNSVTLPQATLPSQFVQTQADTSSLDIACQSVSLNQQSIKSMAWQSFKCFNTKQLKQVVFKMANINTCVITLNLYEGQGVTAQLIHTQNFLATDFLAGNVNQTLNISGNVVLQSYHEYTVQLIQTSSINFAIEVVNTNPYTLGISDVGAGTDYVFCIKAEDINPYTVQLNGQIQSSVAGLNYYMVPAGFIGMWSGSIGTIPEGWALCDGTNGTPDLRDRFIVGAGNSYTIATTGGEISHTLTIAEMPSHSHQVYLNNQGSSTLAYALSGDNLQDHNEQDGGTSTYIKNTGSSQPHENRPPYYALAYIMKLP